MDNYHITKDAKQWRFFKQGNTRATRVADTKKEIIELARDYMSDKTGSVKIHKQDGLIQEERTYPRKKDPRKTPG